ncbi:MAG TPA: DinB family protein [Fulvivirga sp.]|nr:DinB family protein [Fulvivirga sp.]
MPWKNTGHLIHGEKTDWIPRMEIILSDLKDKTFVPFDRFAQYNDSKGKNINELLDEFSVLRAKNVKVLLSKNLNSLDLNLNGTHPELGLVTLSQLLSSWVVHDLNHISQIARVMASQYQGEVGPWKQYLKILNN